MEKYYIKFGISEKNDGGNKGPRDSRELLERFGYKPIPALPLTANKFLKLFDFFSVLFIVLFRIRNSGVLLYYMPSNAFRIRFLKFLKSIFGFQLICYILDVNSFRMDELSESVLDEIKSIAASDIVLVPNENSLHILKEEYGLTNNMIPVGVWDYLDKGCDFYEDQHGSNLKEVAFAGNLAKSPFINDLHTVQLNFNIWGSGKKKEPVGNINFRGEEKPEELIGHVARCSWGLVWDGDSVVTCSGLLGTYLRFNNPHKCGLYLAAGIPVIVWSESGMVHIVNKYHVGICVSSLYEAADIINHMDSRVYSEYRKNAHRIGLQIRKGEFLSKALAEAENMKL